MAIGIDILSSRRINRIPPWEVPLILPECLERWTELFEEGTGNYRLRIPGTIRDEDDTALDLD